MRHHVGSLLDVIHGHFEIPFLVNSGALYSTNEDIRPHTVNIDSRLIL